MSDQVQFNEKSNHSMKLESMVDDVDMYGTSQNPDEDGTNESSSPQYKNPFNKKNNGAAGRTNKVNPNKKYSRR